MAYKKQNSGRWKNTIYMSYSYGLGCMVEIILVVKDTKWFHILMFAVASSYVWYLDFRIFWDE